MFWDLAIAGLDLAIAVPLIGPYLAITVLDLTVVGSDLAIAGPDLAITGPDLT